MRITVRVFSLFLVACATPSPLPAQVVIVDYNPAITALSGTTAGSVTPSTASPNLTTPLSGMALGRGSGLTAQSATSGYNSSGFNSTTLAAALTANQFYTFSINAPAAGYVVDISGINFTTQTSSSGPPNFDLFGSATGFAAANTLQSYTTTTNTTNSLTYSSAFGGAYSNLTAATSFRIVGWNASASGGTFRLNALQINGLTSIRWNGSSSANLSDAANYVGSIAPGSTAGVQFEGGSNTAVTVDSPLTLQGIRFAAGAAAFTLDNSNPLTLTGGGLVNYSSNLQTVNTALTLTALQAVGTTSAGLTITGPISGTGGLNKTGPGTLTVGTLSYTGNTQVNAGVLKTTTGALPATTILGFTNGSSTATLDITGFNQTLAGLTFGTQTTGGTATILGNASTTLATGPATLAFAGANAPGNTVAITMATLGGFTYNNPAGTISAANGGNVFTGTTTVTLPNAAGATNSITALNFNIGNVGGGDVNVVGGGNLTTVNLGPVNTVNATTVNIGTSGSRASALVQFATGLTAPTVAVAGVTGGSSTATLNIGSFDNFGSNPYSASLDTTAGTLTGQFGTILMGRQVPTSSSTARSANNTSTFAFGAGTVSATTMTLGSVGSRATNTGTYNYAVTSLFSITNGGTANIGTITLATSAYADSLTGTNTLNSQVSILNGTLNATSIARGTIATPSSGTWTTTTQVNFTTGTLGNIAGTDLTVGSTVPIVMSGTGTHSFNISGSQTGTINSVVSGAGSPLSKDGTGTLILNGANTFTGAINVNAGALVFTNANPSMTGGVTIAPGATLQWGNNTPTGSTQNVASILNNGAIVVNRNGTLSVSGGSAPITGTGTYTKQGTVPWGMNPASTYSGTTTITDGILYNGSTNALSANSDVIVNRNVGAGTSGILAMNGFSGVIRSLSGNGTVNNALASTGFPTLTIGSGATTATSSTFSGVIADDTNRINIAKAGPATFTQVLSGNNTYSGNTTVNSGTLQLGSPTALGFGGFTAQGVSAGSTTVASGGVLDLGGQANVQKVITLNGTGIGGGALVNSSSTPASIGSGIAFIALVSGTAGGSGYDPAATTVTIAGGGGSGASASLQFGVTRVTFTGGSGYNSSTTSATLSGATGTLNATLTTTVGTSPGPITAISINRSGGYGYTSATAPTVTITDTGTVPGTGATATAFIGVTGVPLTNAGSGYTSVPTVTITGPNTTPATATAVLTELRLGATTPSIGGTGDITINAMVTGTTGFNKVGTNSLILNAANPYTGATTVVGGTLVVNGSTDPGSAVSVTGGTLAGTGTVNGTVSVATGATLRGDSTTGTGNLNLAGTTTVDAGGILATQLATSAGAITANSKLALTGNTLNLANGGAFTILLLNDGGLTDQQSYSIFLATNTANSYQNNGAGVTTNPYQATDFSLVSGSGGLTYTNYSLTVDGSNNLVLAFTAVVPEPGTLLAVSVAGFAVVGAFRRRRAAP
jgi:autotransporter-associated beta strand protein